MAWHVSEHCAQIDYVITSTPFGSPLAQGERQGAATIISIQIGDVLEELADVLICPANPWLNLSGGVNGALLLRGGQSVQDELHSFLTHTGRKAVEPGGVVQTGPGPLAVRWILHAVAIDPFYDSSVELVTRTLGSALEQASQLGARTIVMPMLATGYGRLNTEEFGAALSSIREREWPDVERLTVVVRKVDDAGTLHRLCGAH